MAKRHVTGEGVIDKVRRAQEIIMAQSGVDEYYEIIKILIVKHFLELNGNEHSQVSYAHANELLSQNQDTIREYIEGDCNISISEQLFNEVFLLFKEINTHKLGYHLLDSIFEFLTSKIYKADKGQYFTPRHVVEMMVSTIAPNPDEIICDPASGSGAFLKSIYDYQVSNFGTASKLFGFDYSKRACQMAKTISFMCADNEIKIYQCDSLKISESYDDTIENIMGKKFKGFDAILTNPPFAGDVSGDSYYNGYEISYLFPNRMERDILFIERCIRLLKIGGRLGIILPDSKISSKRFDTLRRWFSKYLRVIGIVSLHRYTFLPYTTQKASVLFAVRTNFDFLKDDYNIIFIQSEMPGKNSNGTPLFIKGASFEQTPYESLMHDLNEIPKLLRSQDEVYPKKN